MSKTICVMGLGYIGLPSAALLASRGHSIIGVDINKKVVDTINEGKIHIVEPDLAEFVQAGVDSGRLKAFFTPKTADIFIIAVPTPFKDDHIPNMEYVIAATRSIAPFIKEKNIVILESTSPVGSTELIGEILQQEGVDNKTIHIAHCPERVLPGRIMIELIENDRVVGGLNVESTKIIADFYRTFVKGEVIETSAHSAEMSKLVENSSRDVQIAFANELSIICDKLNLNVWEVIKLANRHPRVNILNPGTGVGGHCIAVDPWFIVDSAPDEALLIKQARLQNLYKTEWVIKKIYEKAIQWEKDYQKEPIIACMGLSFKPDIDDLRESPAVFVVRKLIEMGINIMVVEPNIKESPEFVLSSIVEAEKKADIFCFLVAHKQFFSLDLQKANCLDFCGIYK